MKKLFLSLALTVLFLPSLMAQDYLITTSGDSIAGKMSLGINAAGREYVVMKEGRKKSRHELLRVQRIVTQKDGLIVPLQIDSKYKFGKVISKGYLSHYKYTREGSTEYFTENFIQKMDGSGLVVTNLGFTNQVSRFLNDCINVSEAVKEKRYTRKNLAELIVAYNDCVNQKGLVSEAAIEQKALEDRAQAKIEQKEKDKQQATKDVEALISDFLTLLEYSDKVSGKEDVKAMFSDVAGKIRRKESVPNYLKKGLEDAIEKDSQLTALLTKILK